MSKVFASLSWPEHEPRPWGLSFWDRTHTHSVFIATFITLVGIPALLWFFLDLGTSWSAGSTDRLAVAQLLGASIFGGVAVVAYLSFQIPRIIRPRIHCCFLISDPRYAAGHWHLGQYEKSQTFIADVGQWVHVRIANVGTVKYSGLSVTCRLPEGWSAKPVRHSSANLIMDTKEGRIVDDTSEVRPEFFRYYEYNHGTQYVNFEPDNDPRQTGSGASSIYSFYVLTPRFAGNGRIHVYISCDETEGTTIKRLEVVVEAKEIKGPTVPDSIS